MDQSISVSAFVAILNETLSFAYPEVTIQGEVSGFKVNQGKWVFFDVKDEGATLGCFMPIYALKVEVEDGMSVRITGSPKLMNWGKFSFTVRSLELAGEGELKRAYELLKAKLDKEGLFSASRKRPLPQFPRRIGLVTSATSAAYRDFTKILSQRWGGLELILADVAVQGQSAPDGIVAALGELNQLPQSLDVIVVMRGGGSLEDLAAFNSEAVVRAIAASRTPVLTGIGHEIDTSLADLAADLRAATPTDAARLVVPDRAEVAQRVDHAVATQSARLERRLAELTHIVERSRQQLDYFVKTPLTTLTVLSERLERGLKQLIDRQNQRTQAAVRALAGYDPVATLKRGYSIVRRRDDIITDSSKVKSGDRLVIQLAKGNIGAEARAE